MLFGVSLFVAASSLGGGGDRDHSRHGKGHKLQALVYHETTGFRHPSIPYAIDQLTLWGAGHQLVHHRAAVVAAVIRPAGGGLVTMASR
jgi:hypothetical protein